MVQRQKRLSAFAKTIDKVTSRKEFIKAYNPLLPVFKRWQLVTQRQMSDKLMAELKVWIETKRNEDKSGVLIADFLDFNINDLDSVETKNQSEDSENFEQVIFERELDMLMKKKGT